MPVSHPLLTVQAPPDEQEQFPAPSQALFEPQAVPAVAFPVRFVQTWTPVEHEYVPVLQPSVQAPPATQLQPRRRPR